MTCPQCINAITPGNVCPATPADAIFFTEIVINSSVVIPVQKPDVEQITNVIKDFAITDVEVLDINLGNAQGRKVIVAGTLGLGIEYSAAVTTQEVHYAEFDIPFQAIIKGDCLVNRGLLPADFDINLYNLNICVEHEQYHILNPREISKVLVVLIWLEALPTDLAVVKDGPATATLNTPFTYTITVTNNGPNPATGVVLTDTVAGVVTIGAVSTGCTPVGNVITCAIGNLAVGASTQITIEVTPTEPNQNITDTAVVQGNGADPNPANNTAVFITNVPA